MPGHPWGGGGVMVGSSKKLAFIHLEIHKFFENFS